jgi:hypothetical protein
MIGKVICRSAEFVKSGHVELDRLMDRVQDRAKDIAFNRSRKTSVNVIARDVRKAFIEIARSL